MARENVENAPEPLAAPEPVPAPTPAVDEYAATYEPRPYLDALTPQHRKVLEEAGQLPDTSGEANNQPRRVEDDL